MLQPVALNNFQVNLVLSEQISNPVCHDTNEQAACQLPACPPRQYLQSRRLIHRIRFIDLCLYLSISYRALNATQNDFVLNFRTCKMISPRKLP